MHNKRIFTIPIVIGLLAVLATTAFAATRNHPASPTVVGTWKMTIAKTATSPETNETMQTFFADGNYLETNNNIKAGSTGQGVWIGSSNNYFYTFQVFTSDEVAFVRYSLNNGDWKYLDAAGRGFFQGGAIQCGWECPSWCDGSTAAGQSDGHRVFLGY